ncbi:hypothetical protein [Paenibacillus maysiensis]|uniref:hypothetical protein n=1 Tax=Paenibacillus maysiensis TaxID=1155954 RepID=UPI0004B7B1DA|nr:hypothetical protein [Paenibacillus maysiensis]
MLGTLGALRSPFDLTIAVAAGFFSIRFLWGKSGGNGERSASSDSNGPLRWLTAMESLQTPSFYQMTVFLKRMCSSD